MTIIAYSYGSFTLHDGVTYFVEKFDDSVMPVNVVLAKIARLEGMKKTGETINERKMTMTMGILSSDGTRPTLESAMDALAAALNLRQQHLIVKSDNRYFVADCTNIQIPIETIAWALVQLEFTAQKPWAYAASASSSNLTGQSLGSGATISFNLTGGGTVFSRPTMKITNTGSQTITGLKVTNTTTSLYIQPIGLSLAPGDYVTIIFDPDDSSGNGYSVAKNGVYTSLYDFSGMFPSLDVGTTAWQITATNSSASTVTVLTTWTPRFLN